MTFKEYSKDRLRNNVERFQRLLDLGAPDLILANELVILLKNAKGAFGEEFVKAQLTYELQGIRQGSAYCQTCDSLVNITRSHHPCCEQCDAKAEAYADEMDRDMRKLEGDEPT